MGWIAAAIVYVAFLYKFPKATVVTSLVLLGLTVLGIGGVLAWGAYDSNVKEKRRNLVTVEVAVSSKLCSTEHPISVTFKNGSSRTLKAVSGYIVQPNMPASYAARQEVSLPHDIEPKSSTTWCFSEETNFRGEPKLELQDGDRPSFEISEYSIHFRE